MPEKTDEILAHKSDDSGLTAKSHLKPPDDSIILVVPSVDQPHEVKEPKPTLPALSPEKNGKTGSRNTDLEPIEPRLERLQPFEEEKKHANLFLPLTILLLGLATISNFAYASSDWRAEITLRIASTEDQIFKKIAELTTGINPSFKYTGSDLRFSSFEANLAFEYYIKALQGSAPLARGEAPSQTSKQRFEKALSLFAKVEPQLPQMDSIDRTRMLNAMAACLKHLERYPEAATYFSRVAHEAQAHNDPYKTMEALFSESQCLSSTGQNQKAREGFAKVIQLANKLFPKASGWQNDATFYIGETYYKEGNYTKARQVLKTIQGRLFMTHFDITPRNLDNEMAIMLGNCDRQIFEEQLRKRMSE